jgi:hypothetical protein
MEIERKKEKEKRYS